MFRDDLMCCGDVFRWSFGRVSVMFRRYSVGVSVIFKGCSGDVSAMFLDVPVMFRWCSSRVPVMFCGVPVMFYNG